MEWAPADVFETEQPREENVEEDVHDSNEQQQASGERSDHGWHKSYSGKSLIALSILDSDNETSAGHVIFVKNLNFDTNEDSLKKVTQETWSLYCWLFFNIYVIFTYARIELFYN